jgi:tetratricopeptide (TPR) repeat protein
MKRSKSIFLIIIAGIIMNSCSKKIISGLKQGSDYNQTKYEYLYVEAIRQKLMGNLGEALKYFEDCIEINPQSDASYYQMAQIVIGKGDLKNGKKYIKTACDIEPGNLWYNMVLAGIYHQENNIDSAIICYERAAKFYPAKEDLKISLARLYTQNKNFAQARNILGQIDEKYGVNEQTTLLLVDNLVQAGRLKDALEKVRLLLRQEPDNINYNGYLAEIYRKLGDSEKAEDVYRQLIERNPDNPGIQLSLCNFLIEEKNFEELFNLLNIILINDNVTREDKIHLISELIDNDDIISQYEKNIELDVMILESEFKNDDIIMLLRPEIYQKAGNKAKAASILENIIRERTENYYAWEKLLFVYYDMKDFKNLEKTGNECATKFNRSIVAKLLYATGATENGNYNVALEEIHKAEILAGDNKDLKLQVQTMRAEIYYRMKDYQKAFEAFDEALKLNNSDITILNNYAYYLAELNMKLKDAERMAKFVIEKEKTNNTYLDTYAWVLFKRGKIRESAKIMERIINSKDNNDAEYYEHYGYILKKMNKCNDAVINWKKALELDNTKEKLKYEIENCKK